MLYVYEKMRPIHVLAYVLAPLGSALTRRSVLNEPSGAKSYDSGINQSIYFLIDKNQFV
jgi:hypothetical protein